MIILSVYEIALSFVHSISLKISLKMALQIGPKHVARIII